MHYFTPDGQSRDRRRGRAVVLQCRPQPRPDRRGDPAAGRRARLRAGVPVRAIRRPSSWRAGSRRSRPAISTTCSSAIRARRRSTPRSRSRSPTTMCAARPARARLIGRERGYHGVGFGGISVGGIVNNRKMFGTLLAGVDHLPHDLQPRAAGLHQGRAGMGRASRRRARAPRRAARRLHHRGRDRRADGRLDRRAAAAEGLSAAPARDLRQARHPADLRRGHHRLRPARPCRSRPSATASSPT